MSKGKLKELDILRCFWGGIRYGMLGKLVPLEGDLEAKRGITAKIHLEILEEYGISIH
jgi:hypothetical protein